MPTTWDDEKESQQEHGGRGAKYAAAASNFQRADSSRWKWNWLKLSAALTLVLCSLCIWPYTGSRGRTLWNLTSLVGPLGKDSDVCPQQQPIVPQRHKDIIDDLNKHYSTDAFEEEAVRLLGGAVKIP